MCGAVDDAKEHLKCQSISLQDAGEKKMIKKDGEFHDIFKKAFNQEQDFSPIDPMDILSPSNVPLSDGDFNADNYSMDDVMRMVSNGTRINILKQ